MRLIIKDIKMKKRRQSFALDDRLFTTILKDVSKQLRLVYGEDTFFKSNLEDRLWCEDLYRAKLLLCLTLI